MITRVMRDAALVLLVISAATAIGLLYGQSKQEVEPPRVAPLVQQLGDDKFVARQAASRELNDIGEAAIPALIVAATKNEDAEIRWRAKQLVRSILMFSKSSGLEWVFIEAGEFQMGSPVDEKNRRSDEWEHRVRISKPFLLGKYEVTQQEFRRVMKTNPSRFNAVESGAARVGGADTRRFPVERVSWFDAIAFCNRLSELDKISPHYSLSEIQRDGNSIKSAKIAIHGGGGISPADRGGMGVRVSSWLENSLPLWRREHRPRSQFETRDDSRRLWWTDSQVAQLFSPDGSGIPSNQCLGTS